MKTISFNNHPNNVAIIDARDGNMVRAAIETVALIQMAPYIAVIVIRNSTTLDESRRKAGQLEGIREKSVTWRSYTPNLFEKGYLSFLPCESNDVYNTCGHDFGMQVDFMKAVGPGDFNVRSVDAGGKYFHLDTALAVDNPALTKELYGHTLTAGITITQALIGGGTIIRDIGSARQFSRQDPGNPSYPHRVWEKKIDRRFIPPPQWQVANGDLCIMRSKMWPETHLPCVHASPPRQRDGDPTERIVGVAFVSGEIGIRARI